MCTECPWRDYVALMNSMLEDLDYEWAEETISGIKETVGRTQHLTGGQMDAIDNIEAAVERRRCR